MQLGDSFESAVRAIVANKVRSVLTMLGVVIGVGSVIAMVGIGEGTKQKSIEQLEIMGSNMITVMPQRGQLGGNQPLRQVDVDRIRQRVPTIRHITGATMQRGNTAKYGNRDFQATITGAEPQIQYIRNATRMHSGRWYTEEDEELSNRVVVLGFEVYDQLYEGSNAIGTTLRIDNVDFEVVGVIEFKGGSGWMNPDEVIYMPLSTNMTRFAGVEDFGFIAIQGARSDLLPITEQMVRETLAMTRRNASGEELFRVRNQAESLEQVQEQSRILSLLLAGIASVSLLVGGIGIMNIMLVSVTERTREIGLRKAIGAKRSTILTQFLLESVVMCLVGGMIGIVVGQFGTQFVAGLLQVPSVMNSQAVVMAFGFSSVVGLFFGLYPAIRASGLQPIEALRYE